MTIDRMDLMAQIEKGADADFLREMIEVISNRPIEMEVEGLSGAAHGVRSASLTNQRNGYLAQHPARRPLNEKLPRERIVHAAPCTCRHCGSAKIRKLDEKVTETLEHAPATWKVIQHVREVFTCRDCERITETPVPSHPIARGRSAAR